MTASPAGSAPPDGIANRDLLIPYFAPLMLYVGLGMLPDSLGREWPYVLRLVLVPALLVWAWRWYVPLRGPRSAGISILVGAGVGVLTTVLWIALLAPLRPGPDPEAAWSATAFGLRLAAATLVVPIFEELVMRGFVLRLALQWQAQRRSHSGLAALDAALDERIDAVAPGAWSWTAIAISCGVFAAGHALSEWPAALAYGAAMAALWIVRRDLVSCISAHAVTNLCLALWVHATDHWALW